MIPDRAQQLRQAPCFHFDQAAFLLGFCCRRLENQSVSRAVVETNYINFAAYWIAFMSS
jgi:hypothetical protein